MKLYAVRHGESENNRNKCYTGWQQVSLTEQGFADAQEAGKFLSKLSFDKVYTSDLIRAVQTAETALPGCQYEKTPLIREINVGELSGVKFSECIERFGEEFDKNRANGDYKPYGGENLAEVHERVNRFLDEVASSGYENVAAFAHGGILRTLFEVVLGMRIPRDTVLCKNCAVIILEFENDRWYLNSWINIKDI